VNPVEWQLWLVAYVSFTRIQKGSRAGPNRRTEGSSRAFTGLDPLPKLGSAIEVKEMAARLIDDIYTGRVSTRVADSMARYLDLYLRAIQTAAMVARGTKSPGIAERMRISYEKAEANLAHNPRQKPKDYKLISERLARLVKPFMTVRANCDQIRFVIFPQIDRLTLKLLVVDFSRRITSLLSLPVADSSHTYSSTHSFPNTCGARIPGPRSRVTQAVTERNERSLPAL